MVHLQRVLEKDTTSKVLGTASAIMAALAARSALTAGWSAMSDRDPPLNLDDEDVGWSEALLFSVASGALAGVARVLARSAATRGVRALARR